MIKTVYPLSFRYYGRFRGYRNEIHCLGLKEPADKFKRLYVTQKKKVDKEKMIDH